MSSVNKVILIGNVGKDPIIRGMTGGSRVASLSLATSETWKDKATGERKEKTEWHNISVFNDNTVNLIEKYVHKGSRIYVEGSLSTRKWTDKSGVEKYTTEVVISKFKGDIVLLGGKGGDSSIERANQSPMSFFGDMISDSSEPAGSAPLPAGFDEIDDNIPF